MMDGNEIGEFLGRVQICLQVIFRGIGKIKPWWSSEPKNREKRMRRVTNDYSLELHRLWPSKKGRRLRAADCSCSREEGECSLLLMIGLGGGERVTGNRTFAAVRVGNGIESRVALLLLRGLGSTADFRFFKALI